MQHKKEACAQTSTVLEIHFDCGSKENPSRLRATHQILHTRMHFSLPMHISRTSGQTPVPAHDISCTQLSSPLIKCAVSPQVKLNVPQPGDLYQAIKSAEQRNANRLYNIILSLSTQKTFIYSPPKENTLQCHLFRGMQKRFQQLTGHVSEQNMPHI